MKNKKMKAETHQSEMLPLQSTDNVISAAFKVKLKECLKAKSKDRGLHRKTR